jgi:hypothetical protein
MIGAHVFVTVVFVFSVQESLKLSDHICQPVKRAKLNLVRRSFCFEGTVGRERAESAVYRGI